MKSFIPIGNHSQNNDRPYKEHIKVIIAKFFFAKYIEAGNHDDNQPYFIGYAVHLWQFVNYISVVTKGTNPIQRTGHKNEKEKNLRQVNAIHYGHITGLYITHLYRLSFQ